MPQRPFEFGNLKIRLKSTTVKNLEKGPTWLDIAEKKKQIHSQVLGGALFAVGTPEKSLVRPKAH